MSVIGGGRRFEFSKAKLHCAVASGFTLIELSIVLVIIGLIVGGILVGQDLIRAAGVRATISQIEKYNTAANTFRGKYGYLPGDIRDRDASSFGFQPRGTVPGTGDGNGLLEGVWCGSAGTCHNGYSEAGGETVMFWVDLGTAHLIDGGFNTAITDGISPGSADATGTTIDLFFPQAKLGHGNYIYVWSGGLNANTPPGDSTNYYGLSAVTDIVGSSTGLIVSNPGLTVREAYSIDTKMDDGLPQSGNVQAFYMGGPGWGGRKSVRLGCRWRQCRSE